MWWGYIAQKKYKVYTVLETKDEKVNSESYFDENSIEKMTNVRKQIRD